MNRQSDVHKIAEKAIESVGPYIIIKENVSINGSFLIIKTDKTVSGHGGQNGNSEISIDLTEFNRIFIIGAGKATAPMAQALEEILGDRISEGLIGVKPGHTAPLKCIKQIEGGHPVPNQGSITAAAKITELAEQGDKDSLFINLISGGGSALLTLPFSDNNHSLTLEDMQAVTQALLSCGATIQEINCIRKHLSSIKGGRLAEKCYPSRSINLILSDVVGDDLQSIASGLTVPDETTYRDAALILKKYGIEEKMPQAVRGLLSAGEQGIINETPKPENECFSNSQNILLGTNSVALAAAALEASRLGYNPVILSSRVTGEAREIAKFYSALAQEGAAQAALSETEPEAAGRQRDPRAPLRIYRKPVCILAGGETTVTIRGNGTGGRNQEMALSFLSEIASRPSAFKGVLFASIATDGNDGPTDAAGAFASSDLAVRSAKQGLSINDYINNNDAYTFFSEIDGLVKTGPTNTNVCDIQIIIIE